MIQWARYFVIVLGSVLVGLVGFLGVSHYTKAQVLGVRNWTGKFIFAIMGISALLGAGIAGLDMAMIAVNTPVGASATVPSYVTVMTPDGEEIAIELSWDVLGQNPVEIILWGEVEVETTAQTEFWIKNAATADVWLTYNTTDWLPPEGNESLTLRWDRVNLNDWAIINGDWSIVQEELQTSAGVREVILVREDPGFNYEASTLTRVISSTFGTPESHIALRYVDSNNYYFAGLGAFGYTAAIGIIEGGSVRMLASGGNPNYQDIIVGQNYDMTVRVAGSTFTVYLDGQEMCTVDDSTFGSGAVGLTSYQSYVAYDDFVVIDAFDPTSMVFQDYFAGPVLAVSESEKVTLFLDVGTPTGWVDFSFNIVITAWDESPP